MAMVTESVKEINKPSKLKLTKKVRVKEHGAESAKSFKAGDTVTVSGKDKYELLNRGIGVYPTKKDEK